MKKMCLIPIVILLTGCSAFVPNSHKVAIAQLWSEIHAQLIDYDNGKQIDAISTLRAADKATYMEDAWAEGKDTTNIPNEVKSTWPENHVK